MHLVCTPYQFTLKTVLQSSCYWISQHLTILTFTIIFLEAGAICVNYAEKIMNKNINHFMRELTNVMFNFSEKSLKCRECGVVASCKSLLKRHVAWQHRGQSEYKCTYCDVMFHSANHLDDHVARHLGFKRYQCPVCKMRYTNEGTLYNHLYRYKV